MSHTGTIITDPLIDAAELFNADGTPVTGVSVVISSAGIGNTRKQLVWTGVTDGTYFLNLLIASNVVHFGIKASFTGTTWKEVTDSSPINVLPLNASVQSRVRGTTIEVFTGETAQISVAIVDATGTAISLAGRTLRIVIEPIGSSTDQVVIEDGSIARSGSTITFSVAGGASGQRRNWSLRDLAASDVVLAYGVVSTSYAPKKDS